MPVPIRTHAPHALIQSGAPMVEDTGMPRVGIPDATGKHWVESPVRPVKNRGSVAGTAVCRCGALSPELRTMAARQRWHEDHRSTAEATNGE